MEAMPLNGLFEMLWWAIAVVIAIFAIWVIVSSFKAWESIGRAIEDVLDSFWSR